MIAFGLRLWMTRPPTHPFSKAVPFAPAPSDALSNACRVVASMATPTSKTTAVSPSSSAERAPAPAAPSNLCRFFLSRGGCRMGSSCAFSHGDGCDGAQPKPSPDRTRGLAQQGLPKKTIDCRYDRGPGGCRNGSACAFKHGAHPPRAQPIQQQHAGGAVPCGPPPPALRTKPTTATPRHPTGTSAPAAHHQPMPASGFDNFPDGPRRCGAGMLFVSHDRRRVFLGRDFNGTFADIGGRADHCDRRPVDTAVREVREELLGVLDSYVGTPELTAALLSEVPSSEVIVPGYCMFVVVLPADADFRGAFAVAAAKARGQLEVTEVRSFAVDAIRENILRAREKECPDTDGRVVRIRQRTRMVIGKALAVLSSAAAEPEAV